MAGSRLRIIVTGLVGLYPLGGVAWDYLQYVIGLARLGHDVYYHEDTWSWPYRPEEKTYTADASYSVRYLADYFSAYAPELSRQWHYLHLGETSYGMDRKAFDAVAATADVFLNVSGACSLPEALSPRCVKVFLDTDPGYNQIVLSERFEWSENVDRWSRSVEAHDQHFTYAENILAADCHVPKLHYRWKTTRMPIVLDLWEPLAALPAMPWTTIMTWNAFKGRLLYDGVEYGSKGAEFEKILDLPRQVRPRLSIAVGGVRAPVDRLASSGWQVVDGYEATATPSGYQRFIQCSRGEISTAKNVYVALRTGWFSCRSACYLATGRPVVVQDTGFRSFLPCDAGLLAFETAEEAGAAIERAEFDYERQSAAALRVARDEFDSNRVLERLLEDVSAGA